MEQITFPNAKYLAATIDGEIHSLTVDNTPNERAIQRKYARLLKSASAEFVREVALELMRNHGHRGLAYELIANHRAAFQSLDVSMIEELGAGINSWLSVDGFARNLSGPAWRKGQISDEVIEGWARSEDLWWRRAALVSTVAWNIRSQGGTGDVVRTLTICRMLAGDHEDMVVKALSWALRELVVHDAQAVQWFLDEYQDVLAARVKREVGNKITTGLKNPRRSKRDE